MRSQITSGFRRCLRGLPKAIQKEAIKAYRLWKRDPTHPSLNFEEIEVTGKKSLWSARVTLGYRVLGGKPEPDLVVWGWIGSHAEYDKLIEARRAKKMNIAQ